MDKRNFIKTSLTGLAFAPLSFSALQNLLEAHESNTPSELAGNEDFWAEVRKGYRLNKEYINLENGYYCVAPKKILEAYQEHVQQINLEGSHYLRTKWHHNRKKTTARLAELLGASEGQVIMTRNTTESLDLVISGLEWQPGDEAVWSVHDYGAMQDQFRLMERRYGINNKVVQVPIHPASDEEIVETYRRAINDKTRLLMICHMINITGHVLPVRKICDMAHDQGVEVMVDGAHTFAHLDFNIEELNCDYFGTSLHKWLSAPIGSGLLYVRKEKIAQLHPIFATRGRDKGDIHRLNHMGTHPPAIEMAIDNAMDYYAQLGAERKETRLRFLQEYWTSKVRNMPGVEIFTPKESHRACAIATVGLKNMTPGEFSKKLMDDYGIWTVPINNNGIQGCRITPNIYTSTKELDAFIEAVSKLNS
ncbi:MAG TPA: aminotransferase class V-fold PLP-dependent enzyme [Saprospiraceae bacterium]|nr:aminotransferase class V-fold PLP-dependent enzyme [Saprospiraceae bacterium]